MTSTGNVALPHEERYNSISGSANGQVLVTANCGVDVALGGEHPTSDHWASGWVASVGVALIALPAVAVLESIGPFIPLIFTKLK